MQSSLQLGHICGAEPLPLGERVPVAWDGAQADPSPAAAGGPHFLPQAHCLSLVGLGFL